IGEVLPLKLERAALDGHEIGIVDDDQGQQDLVPDVQRSEDRNSHDRRLGQLKENAPIDAEGAATIDRSGLLQFLRDFFEEPLENEDRQGQTAVDVRQDEAHPGVGQIQV